MKRLLDRWLAIPAIKRAVFWSLVSGLLFAIMSAAVKYSGQGLPLMQVVFGRSAVGLLLITPFIFYFGPRKVFATDRWKLQLTRCVIGFAAMSCTFYGLATLPLVDVTAINYSKPIFILILAAFFLKEKVTPLQVALTIIGFLGILVILRPTPEHFDPNYLVAVLAAVLVAFAITIVKELTDSESAFSVLAWFSLFSTLFSLPFALFVWQTPGPDQWQSLFITGLFGIIAQLCVIRSYALADASYLAPLGYINIFYTALLGYFMFGHAPDTFSVMGAAVIMASTFYLMKRKKKSKPMQDAASNPAAA